MRMERKETPRGTGARPAPPGTPQLQREKPQSLGWDCKYNPLQQARIKGGARRAPHGVQRDEPAAV